MGHVRLKAFPGSQLWDRAVELLEDGAPIDEIAAASANAADGALRKAAADPALGHAVWLLAQLPVAARNGNYIDQLERLGFHTTSPPSMMGLLAGIEHAAEAEARRAGGRTDLGEMARLAAAASLTTAAVEELPSLFGASAADVQSAIANLGTQIRFAKLSQAFFASLIHRSLDYYLSRIYADHIGPGERFASLSDKEAFQRALHVHCYETARVVEEYSRRWFSEHALEEGISQAEAGRFARRAFSEIRKELRHRRRTDG
jgi:hypothetical protein